MGNGRTDEGCYREHISDSRLRTVENRADPVMEPRQMVNTFSGGR
jgi:hypothetical protein